MDKAAMQQGNEPLAAPQAAPVAQAPNQPALEAPITPVRSAKEAINAMYAQDADKRLSNYLATSAKEIINANSRSNEHNKSAANLHRGSIQHKMESSRPSASGVLRMAKTEPKNIPTDTSSSMDPLARRTTRPVAKTQTVTVTEPETAPVVRTSLKLAPKKNPAVVNPHSGGTAAPITPRTQKGQTALAKLLANRRAQSATAQSPATASAQSANAAESIRVIQQAANQSAAPRARTRRGMMQDIVRQPRPAASKPNLAAQSSPQAAPINASSPSDSSVHANIPADSVKHRFRPAPKDFAATAEVQPEAYSGFALETPTSTSKAPVEIYGLMDEEPTGKPSADNLGVVEDYHPDGESTPTDMEKPASAPDNNKYALGGQSPFFLKSVSVEKRPLSDAPVRKKSASEGTLYQKPSTEPISRKNTYEQKESKKSIPTKPTVIIPASRRSRAPFIALLVLTVILGAAVGAFVYLCFFQYME